MKKGEKKQKQQWPFVRWSETGKKWLVDARTREGGSRKFFATRELADGYARECRQRRREDGVKIFGSIDLAEFGWTVQDAIRFALRHLRQQKNSALIQSAMDEMISLRANSGRSHRYRLDLRVRLGRFAEAFPRRTV